MKLIERLLINSILPKEGKFETLILTKDIRNKVQITQEELVEYEIVSSENGGLKWNEKGAEKEFEIEFTELEKEEIRKMLKKMNDEEKLHMDYLDLYKQFVK